MRVQQTVIDFASDGCTGIPDLWLKECCRAHDYAAAMGVEDLTADAEFFKCIVEESQFLGPFGYMVGAILLVGLAVFRPLYKRYKKAKKSGNIKGIDSDKLNG